MFTTSPRIARIVRWVTEWTTIVAFFITAFILVNGRTTAVEAAVWIGCFSVQAFAVGSVIIGALFSKTVLEAKKSLVLMLINAVLVVATFCAMQASPVL